MLKYEIKTKYESLTIRKSIRKKGRETDLIVRVQKEVVVLRD